jgi:hypothetical protein
LAGTTVCQGGLLFGREDYCLAGTACTLSTIFVRVNYCLPGRTILLFVREDYCLAGTTCTLSVRVYYFCLGLHVLFLSGFTMFVRDSYDTSGLSTGNKNTSNPSRCIPPSTPPVQLLTVSEFPANVRVRFAGTVASFSVKYLGKLHAKISDRETRDAWWDDLR